jgi:cell division transport system ATP-binding protein
MIKFQNVTKIYPARLPEPGAQMSGGQASFSGLKDTVALENVSFEIKEGEFVSIVGRSGAGKTTLLKLILLEEKPTKGRIFFDGEKLSELKPERISQLRRKIGAVFQDYKLLSTKTTFENIAYVLQVIGASDLEIARDVPKILEIVGLRDRANNFPAELSAGERQRASIARAIIHRPKVILADEPTGNLDPYNTREIIKLLLKIHEMGGTLILATHNKEIVNSLGKRVITLEKGKIIRDEERGRFIL